MKFKFCPHCGDKLIKKEIGDEGLIPFCRECDTPLFDLPVSCVIVLAVNEFNEAALIRQGSEGDRFVCVSGYMKIGEDAEICAKREVEEELGVEVKSVEYIKSYPFNKKEMIMFGILAKVKKADFKLSKEVDFANWYKLEEVSKKLENAYIARCLALDCIERLERNGY